MAFELPALPYAADALEPHIDRMTMEIHHGKHHQAYVTNLNNAIAGTEWDNQPLENILANISKAPMAIRNNGGGHWNHLFFWSILSPNGGGEPSPQMNIARAINDAFGSFENFKKEFSAAAMGRFGSGWAWLCADEADHVFIMSTPNQDNPLMDIAERRGTPLLGIDVWEHAYYLHYQNRRADYVNAFFHLINWQEVTRRYNDANPGRRKTS